MKNLFLLVVVVAAAFFAYKKFSPTSGFKGDQPSAYISSDMKLHFQGRDFSLKGVVEFPSQAACEASHQANESFVNDIKALCSATEGCRSANTSTCVASVDEKYKTMLQKGNANVYYLHGERKGMQRVVVVYWGLNDREGKMVCEAGKQYLSKQYPDDVIDCVPA